MDSIDWFGIVISELVYREKGFSEGRDCEEKKRNEKLVIGNLRNKK